MIVSGTLVGVEEKREGSSAAAAAAVGSTAVVVDNGNHFREFGICQVFDDDDAFSSVYTLAEDGVTLNLDDPLPVAVEVGTPVLSQTDTSLPESQVFVYVQLEDGQPPARVAVPSPMRTLALSDSLLIGGVVEAEATADGYAARSLPFEKPTVDPTVVKSLALGDTTSDAVSETFSGTSLPTGWSSTKTGVTGTGSGDVDVPGVSVIDTSTPAGSAGSVLLVDYGASGAAYPEGLAAGEVATSLPDASDAEIMVKFRTAFNTGFFAPDRCRLALRRSGGTAWSSTYDAITLDLIGESTFGSALGFLVASITNDSQTSLGEVFITSDPTTAYHWAKFRVAAGTISAKVWEDGTTEPDWMFSTPYTGVAVEGKASLLWEQDTFLTDSRGQKVWIDEFHVENYAGGFYVDQTGVGDWPAFRESLMADVRGSLPHHEAGPVSSGAFSGTGVNNDVAVSFASAFTVPPMVTVSPVNETDPSAVHVEAVSVTESGFVARCRRTTGTTSFDAMWTALPRTV